MKKLNIFLILTLFGIGIAAENSIAVAAPLDRAPNLNKTHALGAKHNGRLAIAPYAQVVPNNSYTFIGISHPSLATAHTSIGLVVEAMGMSFDNVSVASPAAAKRAVAFTITAGDTHRIFIVNDDHASINSKNPAINNIRTHLITTSSATNQFGSIRVTAVGTEPSKKTSDVNRGGSYGPQPKACGKKAIDGGICRHDNLNQLSMWGVVYQEANGAGFALEFIGDMHDSSGAAVATHGNGASYIAKVLPIPHPHKATGILLSPATGSHSSGVGRGIN